ncbi:hypothetical protein [Bacillus massiliigorillae]|nr:hypothetical protein [Bacillus massiliigorillae]
MGSINFRKVELKKKGHAINLTKGSQKGLGEILVSLNWNQNGAIVRSF